MTPDPQVVAQLSEDMRKHGVNEMELQVGEAIFRLNIEDGNATHPRFEASNDIVRGDSPGVGHFLRSHPMRSEPEVQEGSLVEADAIIGYIATGELLRPVVAPAQGRLVRFLCAVGDLLAYATPVDEVCIEQWQTRR